MPYRRKSRVDEMVEFVDLGTATNRLLRDASGGERRRLSLAATLIHGPDLVFLDEPTAGIDPILRRKFWDHFEQLSEESSTLLITTQYVGEAAYCDYVAVLAEGRMLAFDTPDRLRRLAFAGELLDVSLTHTPRHEDIARLAGRTEIRKLTWLDDRTIRLAVDDSEAFTSTITEWAQSRDVEIEKTEQYLPPFDDVFVELVARLARPAEELEVEAAANAG
jgi:ABC-2 type transport system ATP-binding protein